MSEIEDLSKLKVAELRSELQSRGLDSKGVKAVLIDRLKAALEAEEADNDNAEDDAEEETNDDQEQNGKEEESENENENQEEASMEPMEAEASIEAEAENGQEEEQVPIKEENDEDVKKDNYEEAPTEDLDVKKEKCEETAEVKEEPASAEVKQEVDGETAEVKQEVDGETAEVKEEMTGVEEDGERRGVKRSKSPSQGDARSGDTPKRSKQEVEEVRVEDEPEFDKSVTALDWYNSDLSLFIDKETRLSANPLTQGGFAYVWHGVRATYGTSVGRVFFEVKVEDHISVDHLEEEEQHPHVLRCGWSVDTTSLTLGEEKLSYGYGGTGKASTNLKFKDYGVSYTKGDCVGCFLDMESEPIVMSFTVNGKNQDICYEINHEELGGQALFPHVLTKNCAFKVNFGSEEPWFEPLVGYTFIGKSPLEDLVLGMQGPEKREDCEVVMMVGLPAAGKTTWVEKYCKENQEKRYNVLGTNNLIDKMKVMGLPRKRNYAGRWDNLIEKCTKCLNKLLYMSTKRRRNFIIDQTNVYPSAQKRKLKGFSGFKRRAVVVCPTDDDLKLRTKKRESEEGKEVPDRAILEMKANFKLPEAGEFFDEIEFTEVQKEGSEKLVEMYNKEGERAGYGPRKYGRGNYQGRRGNFIDRRGGGGGGYSHRGGGGGGGGGGGYRGGWDRDRDRRGNFDRRDRGGGWNRDRDRDNRNYNRDNRREGGFHRDRANRGGGGGSWQGSGGYKGSQNQSNLKQTSTWGGSSAGGQSGSYGNNPAWNSQNYNQAAWGQGYSAGGAYNWNQQYYGQQQQPQQQQTQSYWQQAYGQQQTGYGTQPSYGAQQAYPQNNYGYQQQTLGQTPQQQWYGSSGYGDNQYRK